MTAKQANALKWYFYEFQEHTTENRLFCSNKSDNAMLGRLLTNNEIELTGDYIDRINGRDVHVRNYELTALGRERYTTLTGCEIPE